MNDYEAKQAARRERLQQGAAKAGAESNAAHTKARKIGERFWGGQPILVGHHSEGRHRRDLAKMDNAMRNSVEADKRAKDLRARAAAVGTGGISVHDPDAVEKLKAELVAAQESQQRMKDANAAIRKHKKAGYEAQLAALIALGFSEKLAVQALTPDFAKRIGFPAYALQNNGANIRRLEARIASVAKVQQAQEVREQYGTVTYLEEDCRVQLIFPGKPAEHVRAKLRANAFKWSPSRGAWVRQLTGNAQFYGRRLAKYTEIERRTGYTMHQSRRSLAELIEEGQRRALKDGAA